MSENQERGWSKMAEGARKKGRVPLWVFGLGMLALLLGAAALTMVIRYEPLGFGVRTALAAELTGKNPPRPGTPEWCALHPRSGLCSPEETHLFQDIQCLLHV